MAKKGNQGLPSKTSPGKPGKKSTPGKIRMGAAAGFAAIEALRAGASISEVTSKARSQTGFVNPPASPAITPNPAASAPAPGIGYTMDPPSHFRETHGGKRGPSNFNVSSGGLQFIAPLNHKKGFVTAYVDPEKVASNYDQTVPFVDRGGAGGIAGRYDEAKKYIDSGKAVALSVLTLDANGKVSFEDGRHRFAALRDKGMDTIPVAVPRGQAAQIQQLFGLSPISPRELHGRQMDYAAKLLNGEPDRTAWKTEGYAPTSAWSDGARAAGRAFDRMRDEKIYRADVEEAHKSAKIMDKAWSRNRHAEVQAKRQADREEAKLQEEVARRGGGRDDGVIDVTSGSFNSGFNANQKMKELASSARGRQSSFFSGSRDATVIRRGLLIAMSILAEGKPINTAENQLEPFLKTAEYVGYIGGPWARLGVVAAATALRAVAGLRESQWDAVKSRLDVQRMLYDANDPNAESFSKHIARPRALKSMTTWEWLQYNAGFENILEADIKKQTSERIASYNATQGNLAPYGIDFALIMARYAAEKGIDPKMVTKREQNMLLSQTLDEIVKPSVIKNERRGIFSSEIQEKIPWFMFGAGGPWVKAKINQDYFNDVLQGNSRYGDPATNYKHAQYEQRVWWNKNSPEFRRKFDVDTRESQQQAKAIRKRHTQGF